MAMTPEERRAFEALQRRVGEIDTQADSMAQMVQRHEIVLDTQVVKLPIREVDIPPHFHKTDKISYKDLKDGFTILTSTPTMAAEEGKCVLYTTGGAVRVAFKVNQTWRTAALT